MSIWRTPVFALIAACFLVPLVTAQESPAARPPIEPQPGAIAVPQEPRRRPRIPAELSDLLTHSTLAPCDGGIIPAANAPGRLRVATWNIRAARSAPVEEIAAELVAMRADVIALQEVDVRTRRGGFVDQPAALADALGFHYGFAASIKWDEGDYGLAVLSRWPIADVRRHRLDRSEAAEPRIILDVTLCAAGRPLRLLNHHADGRPLSRDSGLAALRALVRADAMQRTLVLGDFNDVAEADGIRGLLDAGLVDLGAASNGNTVDNRRIDYVLAAPALARETSDARVWQTDRSDHHAVVADLTW